MKTMIPILKWKSLAAEKKEKILLRAQSETEKIFPQIIPWIEKVKKFGDKAIVECTRKFDDPDFSVEKIIVTKQEIERAIQKVDQEVLQAIEKQIEISSKFHQTAYEKICKKWEIENIPGVKTGAKITPMDSCGLWVPAGKAPLPTVAQILTVAAAAAKVPKICVAFPPTGEHSEIIAAAHLAGAHHIFRSSGTAAIAAFTFGTKSIPAVCKIAGPGNPFVQTAKLAVSGMVGIDMFAGPSEAFILADDSARPDFLAAEILARCEHGPDSTAVLATDSEKLAQKVADEIEKQFPKISRQKFTKEAMKNGFSAILLFDNQKEIIDFANDFAAEHLQISTKNSDKLAEKIRNAGSVFIGEFSTVPIGDYASGTNHALPTSRSVKFSSPVGVETFLKTVEFQKLTKEGLQNLWPIVEKITAVEGLDAHCKSVKIRIES